MRQLLTIIRYELLMHLKSTRFRGILIIVLVADLGLYQVGANTQEYDARQFFFGLQFLPFYLLVAVFTGLFSIGRIRTSGMQPILMTRPFPTFKLMAGQLIAGLLSLIIPMALLFFPTGLILRIQYQIEFSPTPVLYSLIFYMIPGLCTVMAVTIWVRTCFKNNLTAIIALFFIFSMVLLLANSELLNDRTSIVIDGSVQGVDVRHNFIPMVSFFALPYWRQLNNLFLLEQVSFIDPVDWIQFGLSIVYSIVFLILACYHLRRTEPQRKVLGSYGRRWYHAPTLVRTLWDLRIDPHLGIKSHLTLAIFVSVIAVKSGWPLIQPQWNILAARWVGRIPGVAVANAAARDSNRYNPDYIRPDQILRIRILGDEQELTPDEVVSRLKFRIMNDPTDRLAILSASGRTEYRIASIKADGRDVKFVFSRGYCFVEGDQLAPFADDGEHVMEIRAKRRGKSSQITTRDGLIKLPTRSFYFFLNKTRTRNVADETTFRLDPDVRDLWPTQFTMTLESEAKLLRSPTEPKIAPERELTTYRFDIPAERNGIDSKIVYSRFGRHEIVKLPNLDLKIQFAVPRSQADTMRELLPLIQPVIEEFCSIHRVAPSEPLTLIARSNQYFGPHLSAIKKYLAMYRYRGGLEQLNQDSFMLALGNYETEVLADILREDLGGVGLDRATSLWDLYLFSRANAANGLNSSVTLKRRFKPLEFQAAENTHVNPSVAVKYQGKSRQFLLQRRQIPIFQMLYFCMGHSDWMKTTRLVRDRLRETHLTIDLVESAAEEVTGESWRWFFDYWCRDGEGFPSYSVENATAEVMTSGFNQETRYRVSAEIRNLGTGRMPVPLQLKTSQGVVEERVWLGPGETYHWSVESNYLPREVTVDAENWILMMPHRGQGPSGWISRPKAKVEILSTE